MMLEKFKARKGMANEYSGDVSAEGGSRNRQWGRKGPWSKNGREPCPEWCKSGNMFPQNGKL
jgi:hypothetical protein